MAEGGGRTEGGSHGTGTMPAGDTTAMTSGVFFSHLRRSEKFAVRVLHARVSDFFDGKCVLSSAMFECIGVQGNQN